MVGIFVRLIGGRVEPVINVFTTESVGLVMIAGFVSGKLAGVVYAFVLNWFGGSVAVVQEVFTE